MSVRGGMFLSSSLVAGGPVASASLYGGIEGLSEVWCLNLTRSRLMSVVDLLNVRYVEGWHVCVSKESEPVAVCRKANEPAPLTFAGCVCIWIALG